MNSAETLKQLLWKHQQTLSHLSEQLGGSGATWRLKSSSGDVIWTAEEQRGNGTTGVSAHSFDVPSWIVPVADRGWIEIAGEAGCSGEPVELSALGAFLSSSMDTEAELDRVVQDHIGNTNQLVSLYQIIGQTRETLDLSEKLQVTLEETARQFRTDVAFFHAETNGSNVFEIWPLDSDGQTLRAEAILASCQGKESAFIGFEPETFLAAPLVVDGEIVGWMAAGARSLPGEELGIRETKHVEALAELAAGFLLTDQLQGQFLDNTKLQRELEIASSIQEMLMPRSLPELEGYGIAASCKPASSVGGDFYVTQLLEDGRLAFALGDVTGKGVPAALIMAMTRTVFRSLTSHSTEPNLLLENLSRVLYEDLEEVGKFVTLVLGFLDPRNNEIRVANAGHSPVLYRPGLGAAYERFDPNLAPLGVLPDLSEEPRTFPFHEGAVFVACSDGVTEARDVAGGFYGEERLEALLAEHDEADAKSLRLLIAEDVDTYSKGAPQSDDQTILIISASPPKTAETLARELTIRARTDQMRRVNGAYDELVESAGLDAARTGVADEMKLAMHEGIANIVEHGQLAPDEEICIRWTFDEKGITCLVRSGGEAFDMGAVEAVRPDPDSLPEGGFGLYLLQTLTDEISYVPGAPNELSFSRKWS